MHIQFFFEFDTSRIAVEIPASGNVTQNVYCKLIIDLYIAAFQRGDNCKIKTLNVMILLKK